MVRKRRRSQRESGWSEGSPPLGEGRALRGKALRALAVFLVTLVVLMVLYAWFNKSGPMVAISGATAHAGGWLLNLLGENAAVQGTYITSPRFSLRVIPECTAVSPLIIYLAAIVAYPARLPAKGVGIVLGIASLLPLNQVRIVSLYFLGAAFPDYLGFSHLVVWQSVMVILTVVIWMAWAKKVAPLVPG